MYMIFRACPTHTHAHTHAHAHAHVHTGNPSLLGYSSHGIGQPGSRLFRKQVSIVFINSGSGQAKLRKSSCEKMSPPPLLLVVPAWSAGAALLLLLLLLSRYRAGDSSKLSAATSWEVAVAFGGGADGLAAAWRL